MANNVEVIETKVSKMYIDGNGWTVEGLQVAQTENGFALIKEVYTHVASANITDIGIVDGELVKHYGTVEPTLTVIFESDELADVKERFNKALTFADIEGDIVDVVSHAGQTVFLRQYPFLSGTHENPYFEASAFDIEGNEIVVVWEIDNQEADEEQEMVYDWNKVSYIK